MDGCNRDNAVCDVCTAYVSAIVCTSKHLYVKTKFLLTCQALEVVAHKSGNMLLSRKLPGGQSSRRQTSMHSLHSSLFKGATLQVGPVVLLTFTLHFLSRETLCVLESLRFYFLAGATCRQQPLLFLSSASPRRENYTQDSAKNCSGSSEM